ncbi:hypothetical protein QTP86_014106 [Hemibagrus guttatus]|nr:hypothetical protein QTP86_014106 [Hemibagrus guttatus]
MVKQNGSTGRLRGFCAPTAAVNNSIGVNPRAFLKWMSGQDTVRKYGNGPMFDSKEPLGNRGYKLIGTSAPTPITGWVSWFGYPPAT